MVKSIDEAVGRLLADGGALVGSDMCSTMEIADAKARGDLFVDDEGCGFVLRSAVWLKLAEDGITYTRLNKNSKPQVEHDTLVYTGNSDFMGEGQNV